MQIPTMVYGRRPFGVGLLIAGYDVSHALSSFSAYCIVPSRAIPFEIATLPFDSHQTFFKHTTTVLLFPKNSNGSSLWGVLPFWWIALNCMLYFVFGEAPYLQCHQTQHQSEIQGIRFDIGAHQLMALSQCGLRTSSSDNNSFYKKNFWVLNFFDGK